MIEYPSSLLAIGGAKTGIAPANLLDVQTAAGDRYYWADRAILAPVVITPDVVPPSVQVTVPATAMPWIFEGGINAAYDFGTKNGTAPIIVPLSVRPGQTITVRYVSGLMSYTTGAPLCDANGVPPATGASNTTWGPYPTKYLPGSQLGKDALVGAFTDDAGNVIQPVGIGNFAVLTVPDEKATRLQLGVNDCWFPDGSGSFEIEVIGAIDGVSAVEAIQAYQPWLVNVGAWKFHRSLQTDMGAFTLQNLSGDSLARDFEKIARSRALEGAFFVYRMWQPDAEAAWLEVHGTLTIDSVTPYEVHLSGAQLIDASQSDTPDKTFSESCQIEWGSKRCGATGNVPCKQSFPTCQVIERFMGVLNSYEKNYGEAIANVATKTINRRRKI